ncbi:MAG: hypothetical protein ACT4O1_01215 [Gemmatimonadota bacterium]
MRRVLTAAFVILLAGACGGEPDQGAAAEDMAPMDGMQGMQMGADTGMMAEMESHMKMMEGAGGDTLKGMMEMHRPMAANMLAQFNRDMQQMNMSADTAWHALADSIRQDLTRMPDLNTRQMQSLMPGHMARMRRLMQLHRELMSR